MSAPRMAWTPATTADVQDAVRDSAARRTPLRIVGCGTWLDAGRPIVPDARELRLDGVQGITEYTPGDLTLTARAGTTLAEVAETTAAEGQWLGMDPFGATDHGGSIGATFATASAGPLAHALGLPRDLALGMEVVAGDGEIVRTGGRVVKNVAGFDLTRLNTGAWGTLGIITEITVRLRARPEVDCTMVLARSTSVEDAADVADLLRGSPVMPLAAELLNPALAGLLGLAPAGAAVLLVRSGGNAERVAAEQSGLARLGDAVPVSGDAWDALRRCEPPGLGGAAVVRWSQLPTRVADTWRHAVRTCAAFPGALIHASLARGIVRAIVPRPDVALLSHILQADDVAAIVGGAAPFARIAERLPARVWPAQSATALRDDLSRRVRRAFDPWHVLNPGLLGERLDDD